MKYTIDRQKQYMHFTVHEEKLDSRLAPTLKSEMLTQQAKGVLHIILDLSEVRYIDSSGLSALLVGNRIFQENGGLFILTAPSDHVMKLIKISQLESMLTIATHVAQAIDIVSKHVAEEEKKN